MELIKLLPLALLTISLHADMCEYHYNEGNKFLEMSAIHMEDKTYRDNYMGKAVESFIEAKYACPETMKKDLESHISDVLLLMKHK